MLIEWKDEYSVGNKKIDNQHKHLVDVLNQLYTLANDPEFFEKIDETKVLIDELRKYTIEHFGTEEEYFDKFDYEYAEEHKQQHGFFIKKIEELEKQQDGNEIASCFDVIDYLEDWFLGHITGSDRMYIDFLKENYLT